MKVEDVLSAFEASTTRSSDVVARRITNLTVFLKSWSPKPPELVLESSYFADSMWNQEYHKERYLFSPKGMRFDHVAKALRDPNCDGKR